MVSNVFNVNTYLQYKLCWMFNIYDTGGQSIKNCITFPKIIKSGWWKDCFWENKLHCPIHHIFKFCFDIFPQLVVPSNKTFLKNLNTVSCKEYLSILLSFFPVLQLSALWDKTKHINDKCFKISVILWMYLICLWKGKPLDPN